MESLSAAAAAATATAGEKKYRAGVMADHVASLPPPAVLIHEYIP